MNASISRQEWLILDALSDDWECISVLLGMVREDMSQASRASMEKALLDLYSNGLVTVMDDNPPSVDSLHNEPDEIPDSQFWFGLTEKGCDAWQKNATINGVEPIDWSDSWSTHLNFQNRTGYIDGVSRAVCLEQLKSALAHFPDWDLDGQTVKHSETDGFKAKYYKFISGGHRITFALKKKR